jgi:hypothetical protein
MASAIISSSIESNGGDRLTLSAWRQRRSESVAGVKTMKRNQ